MKICIRCGEAKELISNFDVNKNKPGGYDIYCKICSKIKNKIQYDKHRQARLLYAKEYRERTDRDKRIEYSKVYREVNREILAEKKRAYVRSNKAKVYASSLRARAKNKEYYIRKQKEYYDKHKDKLNEYSRVKSRENPERNRCYSAARKARKMSVPGSFSNSEVISLVNAQFGRCAYCGRDLGVNFHRDHIVPLARKELNPTNYISNIQLTCAECNTSKGSKTHEEYVWYLLEIVPTKYEKYLKHLDYIETVKLLEDWRI